MNTLALAMFRLGTSFDPIRFAFGFVVLICLVAIVIIGVKWLCQLGGFAIPQPLLMILGIIVFLVLLFALVNYAGLV